MIYFGVQLFDHAFHIAALSHTFVPLGHKAFNINNHNQLCFWIRSRMATHNEPNQWYFDYCEFYRPRSLAPFFIHFNYCQEILLVNHRKLVENASFIQQLNACYRNHPINFHCKKLLIPMLLASSLRLFEPIYIEKYFDDDDLPF